MPVITHQRTLILLVLSAALLFLLVPRKSGTIDVMAKPLERQLSMELTNAVASGLQDFEVQCHRAFPHLFTQQQTNRDFVLSSLRNEPLLYEPRVVCITPQLRLFHYQRNGERLQDRALRDILRGRRFKRVDFRGKNAQFLSNVSQLIADAAMTNVKYHLAVGILLAGRVDQHIHHFLFDLAIQATGMLAVEEGIRNSSYEAVRLSDNVLNAVTKDELDRPMWPITQSLVSALLMSNPATPLVSFSSKGSADGRSHCYCQGVLIHGFYQKERKRYEGNKPCWNSSDTACVLFRDMRVQINKFFQLAPFGTPPPLSSFQSLGFWPSVTDASKPRLLLVQRDDRVLGDAAAIHALAEEIGFAVQVVKLEAHSLATQMIASRSTDVLLAVHGAVFNWAVFMDSIGGNSYCRTMIELMTSVPTRFLTFHPQVAGLSEVAFARIPIGHVRFQSRGRRQDSKYLTKLAVKDPFTLMQYNQTLWYNMSHVSEALRDALHRWQTCIS